MAKFTKLNNLYKKKLKNEETLINGVSILSDVTRKEIEKSYNIETIKGTEAHYSDRYGWTLRRIII